jgi:hypothetical protein
MALVLLARQAATAQTLKADYQFQNTRASSVGSSTLTDAGTGNTFQTDTVDGNSRPVLRFGFNQGVALAPTTGVIPSNSYTIVMLFRLDSVSGFVRLVDFKNRASDNGLYIQNGRLENCTTCTNISASTYVQVVYTRTAAGTFTAYVNGVQQGQGPDTNGDLVIDGNNRLGFFQDDLAAGGEASAGNVARIRLYDAPMTPAQVAALDRLSLLTVTNTNDSGAGSLRQAILDSNSLVSTQTIVFNIAGAGVKTISPTTALPIISAPVVIDGYTQPGASANTLAVGNNAVLLIELSGANAGGTPTGLNIRAADCTVRGLVINRWDTGIEIFGAGSSNNRVEGNRIGTNAAGTAALPNTAFGVIINSASNNIVGGTTPAARNLVSGNANTGVSIQQNGASGNLVQGNYIGTDAAGNADLGNACVGVALFNAANNVIGGTAAGAGNVISGNDCHGLGISTTTGSFPATGNQVQGNFIGTNAAGTGAMPNGAGVNITASGTNNNQIGGTAAGAGNVIAFNNGNGGVGVTVIVGTGNALLSNAIFSNGGVGIRLTGGGNNNQPAPSLISVTFAGVRGTLAAAPNTQYRVEVFQNQTCDPSGSGEGQAFVLSANVTTDANGNAGFNAGFGDGLPVGPFFTATATDPNGNTSAFSPCRLVNSFDVSGRVVDGAANGIGGVTVSLTGSATRSTTTDSNGNYAFTNLPGGGNYTVTPTSGSYAFSPASQTLNNLSANRFVNFFGTRTVVQLGGRVADASNNGLGGVTVALSGSQTATTTTDGAGNYSFTNLAAGGSYTVTPQGGTYSPATQQFNNLGADATANFTRLAALACTPPPAGLVAWYPGDGNTNDIVGGNDGTLQNGATFAAGHVGQAFSVDGVDDFVQVADNPAASVGNSVTVDAWVNLRAYSTGNDFSPVISKWNSLNGVNKRSYFLGINPEGNPRFVASAADGSFASAISPGFNTVPLNTFTHIAGVFDSSAQTLRLYVNGVERGVVTNVGFNTIGDNDEPLLIGATDYGQFVNNRQFTNGLIDEVEVFNRALTQAEIQAIFNAGSAGKCRPSAANATLTGRVTNGGAGLPGVTVTLSGAVSATVQTDASGNYAFANLTVGGNYTVTPAHPLYVFAPARADINNLSASQVINFATQPNAVPAPTPPLTDDFNSAQRDPTKWNLGTLSQPAGAFDPFIPVVQQNGRLVITPRANVAGAHFNGYVSVNSFDFTGGQTSVEVVQAAGGAETAFAIGSDNQNNYRFAVTALGNAPPGARAAFAAAYAAGDADSLDPTMLVLVFQVRISGVLTQAVVPYDPVAHRFFRFRHDAPQNAILFETSPDNITFTERFRKSLEKNVVGLAVELTAGTAAPTGDPGAAVFDNLALITSTAQFNAADFAVNEGDGRAIITVTRAGNVSGAAATLTYATVDNPAAVRCDDTQTLPGVAFARCDYATSVDTITFAAGETSKSFAVPIVDDGFAEGRETFQLKLLDASGASLGAPALITVTIQDNDQPGQPNPVFEPNPANTARTIPFFVRQHYLDFLAREPEQGEPWSGVLTRCLTLAGGSPDNINNTNPNSPSAGCDRLIVSGSFFGSPEFKDKGVYLIVFYRAALNRLPTYAEFAQDLRSVTGATPAETNAKRAAFAVSFTRRGEFASQYGGLTNAAYVNALLGRYNLTSITTPDPANPDGAAKVTLTSTDLSDRLTAGTLTRAQVLRAIVQSDQVSQQREAVNAFVAAQYYGYLRRTPDTGGFNNWVNYLTAHPSDFRTMVNGFMNSVEYRLRFGPSN